MGYQRHRGVKSFLLATGYWLLATPAYWLLATPCAAQQQSVLNSAHNLSAMGPGAIRAAAEQEVCIFCHTPHHASPIQPLWNRNLPVTAYTPYTSNSLQATPGQPTGSSKLCLSCHDGTIAIGSVVSRGQPITMAGGITTIPPGSRGHLGTDLRDDHPISFRYDADLATRNPKLRAPAALPPQTRLDGRGELQCTTCHEPHNNAFGKFLVMDNRNSQLCATCHQQGTTGVAGHQQCSACHQPHTAPSGPYLLKGTTVTDTCTACHAGQPGTNQGPNIAADLAKISRHDTHSPVNLASHVPTNLVCRDCHEPHTMLTGTAAAPPLISPKLGSIGGINSAGTAVARAQYQYEVCYKCHADQPAMGPHIPRQIVQNNTRLEFSPTAVSYHPVQAAGRNPSVPSLLPPLTTASLIYCTDCHASDTSKAAGATGPNGPHGSGVSPLLLARYDTTDNSTESAAAYALCYKCHNRSQILSEQSPFKFHKKHIVDARTPCSICHDAHGVSSAQGTTLNNAHLMNFDTRVALPDPVTRRLEYRSLGPGRGECYLTCHGTAHSPKRYPD